MAIRLDNPVYPNWDSPVSSRDYNARHVNTVSTWDRGRPQQRWSEHILGDEDRRTIAPMKRFVVAEVHLRTKMLFTIFFIFAVLTCLLAVGGWLVFLLWLMMSIPTVACALWILLYGRDVVYEYTTMWVNFKQERVHYGRKNRDIMESLANIDNQKMAYYKLFDNLPDISFFSDKDVSMIQTMKEGDVLFFTEVFCDEYNVFYNTVEPVERIIAHDKQLLSRRISSLPMRCIANVRVVEY